MGNDDGNWWGTWSVERFLDFLLIETKWAISFIIGMIAGQIFITLWRM